MVEILICVRSDANPDLYIDCQRPKRGDVIAIGPDGNPWGQGELTNPDWRIFSMPSELMADAESLISPEMPVDPTNPSKTLQYRGHGLSLDVAHLPSDVQAYLADSKRTQPIFAVSDAHAKAGLSIAKLKAKKVPVADPHVIGNPRHVIG